MIITLVGIDGLVMYKTSLVSNPKPDISTKKDWGFKFKKGSFKINYIFFVFNFKNSFKILKLNEFVIIQLINNY